jgi:fatty-acid desaturase
MSASVKPLRTGIQRGTGPAKRIYAAGGPAASKNENGHYRINWISAVALTVFHLGAVAALFFFSWKALIFTAILYWMTLSFGIGMGYHRLLTHRGYQVPKWMEYAFAIFGTMALEGGPIAWVAVHRIHHQHSDQEGDPHSPLDGAWWAHLLWMITGDPLHNQTQVLAKYVPDMAKNRFYVLLSQYHWIPLAISGIIIWATLGFPFVLWMVFLRVTLGLHATWLVNSATHMWGKRRFVTRDSSRNSWWVALLTFGEGWHNNHHAHPTSARHGLAWYELDVSWIQIWLLRTLGIARKVQVAKIRETAPTQVIAA